MKNGTLLELIWKFNKDSITLVFFLGMLIWISVSSSTPTLMLLFKTKCPSLHLLVHQSCHLHYGTLNVSLRVRESGFRNLGNFCFWNPESSIGHGGMRTFYVFGIFYIGIWPWPWDHAFNCQFNWQLHSYTTPESWKYLLVDSGIQGFGMRNTNHGIGNLTIDWNPVS